MGDLPPPVVHAAAPLHMDLAGSGGLPAVALGEPASALTVTLALEARVEIRLGGRTIRLRGSDPGEQVTVASPADLAYDGRLDAHKAALNMLPVTGGIEMLTANDVPSATGLRSGVATSVALLAGLAHCRREGCDGEELAGLAIALGETELGRRTSRMDAWAVVLGGGQLLVAQGDLVEARPIRAASSAGLTGRMVLVPLDRSQVGGTRRAVVIEALARRDPETADAVQALEQMVPLAAEALGSGAWGRLAEIFQASFAAQQRLDPVLSAAPARALQDRLRAAGAAAWKVTSGSRGGSLLVLCDPERREAIAAAIRAGGGEPLAAAPGAGIRVWEEEAGE